MNEAFLYEWLNSENGMRYIGVHKGSGVDGYISSSTNELFWEDYYKGKLNRGILRKGSYASMNEEEDRILQEADAKNNPLFYNRSNGGGKKTNTANIAQITSLASAIKNNELDTIELPIGETCLLYTSPSPRD